MFLACYNMWCLPCKCLPYFITVRYLDFSWFFFWFPFVFIYFYLSLCKKNFVRVKDVTSITESMINTKYKIYDSGMSQTWGSPKIPETVFFTGSCSNLGPPKFEGTIVWRHFRPSPWFRNSATKDGLWPCSHLCFATSPVWIAHPYHGSWRRSHGRYWAYWADVGCEDVKNTSKGVWC